MIISFECTRCTHKCLTDNFITWLTEVSIVHFLSGGWRFLLEPLSITYLIQLAASLDHVCVYLLKLLLLLLQALLDSFHFVHRTELHFC